MKKHELLKLTGNQFSCAANCEINHQCFGGFVNEELECEASIEKLLEIFKSRGYAALLMTQNFFGIRVFDSNSNEKPLPVIGDILINHGNLTLKDEIE